MISPLTILIFDHTYKRRPKTFLLGDAVSEIDTLTFQNASLMAKTDQNIKYENITS